MLEKGRMARVHLEETHTSEAVQLMTQGQEKYDQRGMIRVSKATRKGKLNP